MRGQTEVQVVKKKLTMATLPFICSCVNAVPSCVVKLKGCTLLIGGILILLKPGMTTDIVKYNTSCSIMKKRMKKIAFLDIRYRCCSFKGSFGLPDRLRINRNFKHEY